ncbi:MAG: chemotaxis protein CheX [Exilispira sp.]
MNIDFINPFVEASYEILKEVLQCEIKREDIYLQSRVSNIKGIAALIGLLGEVEGRLILDMDTKTALQIASKMTQENFTHVDDMVINVITEIANMITANAITKLHNRGYNLDLTTPSIIKGNDVEITDKDLEALVVPLRLEYGLIEINVATKEK